MLRITSPAMEARNFQREVEQLLMSLNFNSVFYFAWCTNKIADEVNLVETHARKVERLSFFLKAVNQVRDKPDMVYDQRYESLKEQVAGWIIEELNFQEKTHQPEIRFSYR